MNCYPELCNHNNRVLFSSCREPCVSRARWDIDWFAEDTPDYHKIRSSASGEDNHIVCRLTYCVKQFVPDAERDYLISILISDPDTRPHMIRPAESQSGNIVVENINIALVSAWETRFQGGSDASPIDTAGVPIYLAISKNLGVWRLFPITSCRFTDVEGRHGLVRYCRYRCACRRCQIFNFWVCAHLGYISFDNKECVITTSNIVGFELSFLGINDSGLRIGDTFCIIVSDVRHKHLFFCVRSYTNISQEGMVLDEVSSTFYHSRTIGLERTYSRMRQMHDKPHVPDQILFLC